MGGFLGVVIGLVIGVVLTVMVVVSLMRNKMLTPVRSHRSFEDTCAAIERAVPEVQGWGFPMPSFDMKAALAERGHPPDNLRKIRLYFICNPSLAKRVLEDSPKMTAIMPCSWAVFENDNDEVWISKMNIGLMSRLFGGEVEAAMSQVAATDEQFLNEAIG